MYIDIESGANVDHGFSMLYKDVGTPREVYCVKYRVEGKEQPVQVTGWDHQTDSPCPAYACPIEESGDGIAMLVYGGSGGLRFKKLEDERPWALSTEGQWSETHLVYPRDCFIVYQDQV